jgi:putative transposase
VKYAFMEKHRSEFDVRIMCRVLGVSASGFYDWRRLDRASREKVRAEVAQTVFEIHRGSRQTYGSPRVYRDLRARGIKCGKHTVERIMRDNDLRARARKKHKATTNSAHSLPVADNIVARNFSPAASDTVWCADITYIGTEEGWLYLAVVVDLFSRKVVGWSMQDNLKADLAIDALEMAVLKRQPGRGLVFHSDHGVQYACKAFKQRLWVHGMTQSMSRRANCWDNAVVESFFHTLKVEHVFNERYRTREQARSSIFEWIEVFYNRRRMHSTLGYVSPECYERQVKTKCA